MECRRHKPAVFFYRTLSRSDTLPPWRAVSIRVWPAVSASRAAFCLEVVDSHSEVLCVGRFRVSQFFCSLNAIQGCRLSMIVPFQ